MYFFRGAIPVAAFAAPCLPWGLLNPIHGIQNSEKTHFSYGLFLTSLILNLVVYFLILLAQGCGAALPPVAVCGGGVFTVVFVFLICFLFGSVYCRTLLLTNCFAIFFCIPWEDCSFDKFYFLWLSFPTFSASIQTLATTFKTRYCLGTKLFVF